MRYDHLADAVAMTVPTFDDFEDICEAFEDDWSGHDPDRLREFVAHALRIGVSIDRSLPEFLAMEFDLLAQRGESLAFERHIVIYPKCERVILASVGAHVARQLEALLAAGELTPVEQLAGAVGFGKDDPAQLLDLFEVEHRLRRQYQLATREHEYMASFADLWPSLRKRLITGGLLSPEKRKKSNTYGKSTVSLQVLTGPHQGEEFHVSEHDSFVVGRGSKCGIRLGDDPYFSRYHFRIEANPPQCHLVDLESRNGTYVNQQLVRESPLRHGDQISGGQTAMQVRIILSDGSPALPNIDPSVTWSQAPEDLSSRVDDILQRQSDRSSVNEGEPLELAQKHAQSIDVPAEAIEIAGYTVQERIHSSSSRSVYRAVKENTGELVAIKLYHSNRKIDEQTLKRLSDANAPYRQLEHRRVSRVIDVGVYLSHFFVVSQYIGHIDSQSAWGHKRLESRIRLATGVICFALEVLDSAHRMNWVHGNLQPKNVLIAKTDSKLGGRVTDFGLTLALQRAGLLGIYQADADDASMAYLPPERLLEIRNATPAGDLYSIGATLYYFLSGSHPVEKVGSVASMASILNQGVEPIHQRHPEIPVRLSNVIEKAMSHSPSNRFASAADMYRELVEFARRTS